MDWVPAVTVQTTIGVGGFFSIDGAGRTGHDYCFPGTYCRMVRFSLRSAKKNCCSGLALAWFG